MRVISGFLKGKKLKTLDSYAVRPTTDKVKESLFNIIQFEIYDKVFLDLFSGSGQVGIEALSRGAKKAFFVDKSHNSLRVIKYNLKNTDLLKSATVINSDSINFLNKTNDKFDIAFLDPPYKTGALQKALNCIFKVMNEDGIIVCENPINEPLPEILIGSFYIKKIYKYGKIKITIYRKDV